MAKRSKTLALKDMGTESIGKEITIENASNHDVGDIMAVLLSNASEPALYQRNFRDVRRNFADFLVAKDPSGQILGCAAVHKDTDEWVELLSVAAKPESQRQGIGQMLVENAKRKATTFKSKHLWLTTTTPQYFAQFGFQVTTLKKLPLLLLLLMILRVFLQPVRRWPLAFCGLFTFMTMSPIISACKTTTGSLQFRPSLEAK